MFVMSMLDRLTDVKKSTYAKIIAVLVSVAMVLSLTNMSAFAEGDGLSGIFGGNSDVVKVAVDLDNAKIEYGDQTVTNADKTFVASAGKDLKFKASAVTEDFTLDEVALVTTAENGSEVVTGLEGIDGTYTIKADDVADGITIKASATEQKTAAKDSTVITDNQSGDGVTGTETTEPGTTDNGTAENGSTENGTTEEPSTETPAAGTPETTTPEGTPADTVAEPTTETPAGTTTPAAEPVENVVTDNVANTVRSSVVSFAKAFTANTGIETYAAEPMADSTYTVVIGKNITIAGNGKWNHYHEWSSSDPSVVTVSGNGSKATVTAKKTGTVTIYHYYGVWGYEAFTVNVVDSTTTVYVYVKLSGSDTSWTVNKDGWFTIGSIEIPTSVLKQAKDEEAGYYADSIDINKTFDFKTLVRHSDNANIALDFSKIDWTTPRGDQKYGLHVVKDGASGYSVSGHQWHLDGYLDITQKHSANVTYSYANEAEGIANKPNLPTNISQQDLASGTKVEFEVPEITGYAPEIKCDGKTVTDLEKNENGKYCITIVNSDVNVEVIYHPCTYPYTVKYLEQGTNKELHAPTTVAGNLYNAQVTVNAIDIAGYNKINPASSTITISEGNNEITFYYTKRTDLGYTVNYVEFNGNGTTTEIAKPQVVIGKTFGEEVTENAIDIAGYNKVNTAERPSTITFNVGVVTKAENGTELVSNNEITFYYTKRTDLSYTVNYLEQGTNAVLHEAKTVNGQTFGAEVTETAESIDGYNVDEQTKKIDSMKVSGNEITFYYTKSTYNYEVHYFYEDAAQTATEDVDSKVEATGTYGDAINYDTNKTTYNEQHYVLDRVEGAGKSIGTDATQNVVNVYYAIDQVTDTTTEDPTPETPGDNVADKYQATIIFTSADETQGTVSGETNNVVTLIGDDNNPAASEYFAPLRAFKVNTNPAEGYVPAGWSNNPEQMMLIEGGKTYTFTMSWQLGTYNYEVHYFYEDAAQTATEDVDSKVEATGTYGDAINYDTNKTTYNEQHYVLDRVEGAGKSIGTDATQNVVNVYYAIDQVTDTTTEDPTPETPGDNVADKYQATIIFTSADETQGTVSGNTTQAITLRDAEGNLVESADVELTADGVVTNAAQGYTFFNWTGAEFGTQTLKGNDVVIFVANWAEDNVGTDPTNPDEGDGIPDMYQTLVQYVAVNGSVNIDHTYVTLLDENGQPSENGTGYLTAEQIAVATAAEGYDQDSLAWDVVPTTENAITGEVTYTVTFTANQPVVPADPGTPGTTTPTPAPADPVPGAAPAALAPVAAALAAPVAALIGDEPTPLAEEAIGDEEDPLAAFDHVNCWVHYYMILGILLTLVYGGCVIARRSNYSRKIQKMDNYATGKAMDTVEETENVANAAAQKMEA